MDDENSYEYHFVEAEHWLNEADGKTPEAGRECLASAAIHAVLALAAAIDKSAQPDPRLYDVVKDVATALNPNRA